MAIDINELDIPVRLKFLDQVQGQLGQLGQRGATVANDVERSFERASTVTRTLGQNTEMATRTFSRAAIGAQALAVGMQSGRVSAGGLASVLLTMGPAGGVGAAVLSGLALAATAMSLFTANTREARKEAEDLARSLDRFNELSTQQLENQRLVAVAEQAAIRFSRQTATGYREASEAEARRLTELYNTIQRIDTLLAGRAPGGHYAPGSGGGTTGRGSRSTPTRTDYFGVREGTVLRPGAGADLMPDAAVLERLKQMQQTVELTAKAAGSFAAALEHAAEASSRIKGALEANKAFMGAKGGDVGGVDAVGAFRGVMGGNPLSMVMALTPALGGLGAVAGPVVGIMGDLGEAIFGGGHAAELAAIRHRKLQEAYELTLERMSAVLRGDSLAASLADLEAEFRALREQAIAAYGVGAGKRGGVLDSLAELQRQRKEQIVEDFARARQQTVEDLRVRALRAAGQDEQAETLAFAIQQQREYAEAVRNGADAALLATLAQVQMAERNRRIAELARETVAGLTSFRTSLMLGPQSALNPFAQYQEARRQYEDVLAAAQGGDRAAAGRLPEVARAFLDASRGINASSRAYANDFGRVQTETEELIRRFNEYAIEIEPEILNVSQHHLAEAEVQTAVLQEQNDHLAAAVVALQAGFLELLLKQDQIIVYADEQAVQLRRLTAVT